MLRYPLFKRARAVATELRKVGQFDTADAVEQRVSAVENILRGYETGALAKDLATVVEELRSLEATLIQAGMGLPRQRERM